MEVSGVCLSNSERLVMIPLAPHAESGGEKEREREREREREGERERERERERKKGEREKIREVLTNKTLSSQEICGERVKLT